MARTKALLENIICHAWDNYWYIWFREWIGWRYALVAPRNGNSEDSLNERIVRLLMSLGIPDWFVPNLEKGKDKISAELLYVLKLISTPL